MKLLPEYILCFTYAENSDKIYTMCKTETIRINKYISSTGFCSRREADRLVEAGRVTVDGDVAVMGTIVCDGQCVRIDGRVIEPIHEYSVYALNKPVGYISSLSDKQGQGISCFVPKGLRLYPVGRLDKDSEGLMLLTNDGEMMNNLLKASEGHEKEYLVTVDKSINRDFLCKMEGGVPITNKATGRKVTTAACKTKYITDDTFSITLIQGLNRQIRRMCGFFGYKVTKLVRVRIKNITLGNLKIGSVRKLTDEEVGILKDGLK